MKGLGRIHKLEIYILFALAIPLLKMYAIEPASTSAQIYIYIFKKKRLTIIGKIKDIKIRVAV